MRHPVISFQTHTSQPIRAGRQTIRLTARSLKVVLPGASGGFVLTSPNSVLVQSEDGVERALPVRDLTRWVELGLWLLPVLVLLTLAAICRHPGVKSQPKGVLS